MAPACALIGYDHDFAEQLLAFTGDGVAGESCFDRPGRLRAAAMRNRVLQGAYLTLSARVLGGANMSVIFAAALGYSAGPTD